MMRTATSRREFLKAAAAAASLVPRSPTVHAAGSDTLRVGLIGCGGRGTGAATQALAADPNVKLVAMGDAFEDRLAGEPRDAQGRRRRSAARSTCRPSAASSASTPTRS